MVETLYLKAKKTMTHSELVIEKMRQECIQLSNNNLLLRKHIENQEKQYAQIRQAFNELLDLHLEMRDKWGFGEFTEDYKYDWIEKAGLTDQQ